MTDDWEQHFKEVTRRVANELNELIAEHEQTVHDGEPCREERINTLAFLAHRIGVRDRDSIMMFLERLLDYEAFHEEHGHG